MTQATQEPTKRARQATINDGGGGGTQLLDKALNIVELVAHSNKRLTAHDIAIEMGYTKPTAYRILAALVRRGMLSLDNRDQAYELGLRFSELTTSLRSSHRFLMLIENDLINLSARTGETVTVGIAEKDSVRIVSRYSLGYEVTVGASSGSKRPFHASGIGKVALAFLPVEQSAQYMKRIHFQALTPRTLQNEDALEEELRLIRARGYAIDDEEIIEGVRCVAQPLLSRQGELIGAISLSAPTYRMPPHRVRTIAIALGHISNALAERLSLPSQHYDAPVSQLSCLHEGGLFKPLAIGMHREHLVVMDAMAPALHFFTADGMLIETRELPFTPRHGAISANGQIMLARGREWFEWISTTQALVARGEQESAISALAFDGERLYLGLDGDSPRIVAAECETPPIMLRNTPRLMACDQGRVAVSHSEDAGVELLQLADGASLAHVREDASVGDLCGLMLHNQTLFTTGDHARYIRQTHIETGSQDYLIAPECHITAIARVGDHIYLAGANLDAVLDDESTHIPGSLYRLPSND
ncbi:MULTISPECIES: IclR family transcriptional regulator [Halomonadaceae]|uniref:HTH-type transcriptional repressor AllR n=1 Tax=Vreelandella titanicae TaxID=664683 RepID=A0AAP9T272_9GAMM|nr:MULTISPECIES: IclR family transcriptional regulator [Halomonas]QKS25623.1 Transcriptional repressor IclR [Halomonas titanicae]CDG53180.1 IclR family transcriptional regulator [Halomonas sp. A3H3]